MTKILLNGCSGRMGQVVTALAAEDPRVEIAAGVDIVVPSQCDYPVFGSLDRCDVAVDVIIDFSSPKVFDALIDFAAARGIPAVICTTGLSKAQVDRIREASDQVALLRSANMSLGVNTLLKLLQDAAKILAPAGFDMEIVERHHARKKDAPSGTALALADSLNEALDHGYTYVYDRSDRYEQRGEKEIGISAVRGGTIVGQHEVIFAGTDEVIEFKHTAYSRAIFAKGAIAAAAFLAGQAPGLYDMSDVIGAD